MELQTVESSMIHALGYDKKQRILEIIFNNGGIYQYRDVPLDVFKSLTKASSKGRFLNSHIRNMYPYARANRPIRRKN